MAVCVTSPLCSLEDLVSYSVEQHFVCLEQYLLPHVAFYPLIFRIVSRYKPSWMVGICLIWWISNSMHPTGLA